MTRCRRLLEEAVGDVLEGRLGIRRNGQVEDADRMGHLSEAEMEHREEVISHLRHIEAGGFKPADAVAQLIREVAYTHLNRLCAYKMLERRRLIREAVGRGIDSNGFKFYLVDHPEDEKLWTSGQQDVAYRHFLGWLGGTLSEEIGVLFSPTDPANRLFPPQRTLDAVLDLINGEELDEVWDEEETIGWVYQYYTPKELRDQARKESQAPRNSYELSFRNQFYTPRLRRAVPRGQHPGPHLVRDAAGQHPPHRAMRIPRPPARRGVSGRGVLPRGSRGHKVASRGGCGRAGRRVPGPYRERVQPGTRHPEREPMSG